MSDVLTQLPKGVLDAAKIAELMAGTRTRNAYGPRVLEFHESGEAAINPMELWPEFAGKNATSLYQGFLTAIKKADLAEKIRVIKRDEDVFLLNVEQANLVMQAQTTDSD